MLMNHQPLPGEGREELGYEALGNRVVAHADLTRRVPVRVAEGAEDDVPDGKDVGVVAVGEPAVNRMVQGMELRGPSTSRRSPP